MLKCREIFYWHHCWFLYLFFFSIFYVIAYNFPILLVKVFCLHISALLSNYNSEIFFRSRSFILVFFSRFHSLLDTHTLSLSLSSPFSFFLSLSCSLSYNIQDLNKWVINRASPALIALQQSSFCWTFWMGISIDWSHRITPPLSCSPGLLCTQWCIRYNNWAMQLKKYIQRTLWE